MPSPTRCGYCRALCPTAPTTLLDGDRALPLVEPAPGTTPGAASALLPPRCLPGADPAHTGAPSPAADTGPRRAVAPPRPAICRPVGRVSPVSDPSRWGLREG